MRVTLKTNLSVLINRIWLAANRHNRYKTIIRFRTWAGRINIAEINNSEKYISRLNCMTNYRTLLSCHRDEIRAAVIRIVKQICLQLTRCPNLAIGLFVRLTFNRIGIQRRPVRISPCGDRRTGNVQILVKVACRI